MGDFCLDQAAQTSLDEYEDRLVDLDALNSIWLDQEVLERIQDKMPDEYENHPLCDLEREYARLVNSNYTFNSPNPFDSFNPWPVFGTITCIGSYLVVDSYRHINFY